MPSKRQNELIDYLLDKLIDKDGVRALYLKGSLANESDDEYSDVDFYCLVKEEVYDQFLRDRDDLLKDFKSILYHAHVNFNYPQVVAIYDNDLHLDFYITKDLPDQGFSMKVLYDPNNLLKYYKTLNRQDDKKDISSRLKTIIYTYHELYIAFKRNDKLWTTRLISHILADMSLIFDQLYPSDRPVLHMKGVYLKLPQVLKDKLNQVFEYLNPDNTLLCMRLLIDLTEDLINHQTEVIDTSYLKMMKKKVIGSISLEAYNLEDCHELYKIYESDPQMTYDTYAYSKDKVDKYYKTKSSDENRIMFSIKIGPRVIGEIQLKYIDYDEKHGTLSIILANDTFKNKGYGKEAEKMVIDYAFDTLDFNKIYADTTIRNVRSKAVLSKLGFTTIKQENEMDYFVLRREDYKTK